MTLALAFFLTVTIEWGVLAWFSRLGFARTGWFCLAMNALTWGVAMGARTLWSVPIPLLEALIIAAEAALLAWFWPWSAGRAIAGSLLMNLASWLLGTPLLMALVRGR